jgi:hypothetical protein
MPSARGRRPWRWSKPAVAGVPAPLGLTPTPANGRPESAFPSLMSLSSVRHRVEVRLPGVARPERSLLRAGWNKWPVRPSSAGGMRRSPGPGDVAVVASSSRGAPLTSPCWSSLNRGCRRTEILSGTSRRVSLNVGTTLHSVSVCLGRTSASRHSGRLSRIDRLSKESGSGRPPRAPRSVPRRLPAVIDRALRVVIARRSNIRCRA